jgi:hypothetical protein
VNVRGKASDHVDDDDDVVDDDDDDDDEIELDDRTNFSY